MSYYVFEPRMAKKTPLWQLGASETIASTKHEDIGGDSINIEVSITLPEYEVLDLSGGGEGLLASQAAATVLSNALPEQAYEKLPVNLTFTETETPYFYFNVLNAHSGLIDFAQSDFDFNDENKYLDGPNKIVLDQNALSALPPESLVLFILAELPSLLLISDAVAKALEANNLTGFKLFPLDSWREGIALRDSYLYPRD